MQVRDNPGSLVPALASHVDQILKVKVHGKDPPSSLMHERPGPT